MGSRGAFENIHAGDFTFREGGQLYHSIGEIDGIKVLVMDAKRVKAPEYSHTAERIYAIVQNGKLKHLAYYDEDHNQSICIDFLHSHHNIQPHKHLYLDHSDDGISITKEEQRMADKIRRRFHLT